MYNRYMYYEEKAPARRALLVSLLGGTCVNCGTTEQLEFDHVMCDRKFPIGNHILNSLEYILPELQKCQLLCSPCHKAKTSLDLGRNLSKHSMSGYNNRGCRCRPCRDAWNAYITRRRHGKME